VNLADHADHTWSQKGRCVYCDTCKVRLYQGKLPVPGQQKNYATATDAVLNAAREHVLARVTKEWDERTPEQTAVWEQGRASYVMGESIMDRMRRGNPYKDTPLAKWFNLGWQNAENAHFGEDFS
jgi:hypothetical protein